MKPLTIAVNARFLLKDKLEGIGWYTYEVLKRMVMAYPEDTFIFFFDRPFDPNFVFAPNVKPIVLQPPARHPFLFVAWFEWSVARALKRIQPDVFLSTDNFLTLRTTVPTCLVLHDMIWHHQPPKGLVGAYYRYFMPRFLQKAARIVTVSEYVRQDAIRVFPAFKDKIHIAHNGCRAAFKPIKEAKKTAIRARFTEGGYYMVFVGAVHPRKNVHRLISAFDKFKTATQSDWKLLIVGRMAWETGEVTTAYDAAKHQKDIIFTGYVDNDTIAHIVAAAVFVAYPSLAEGFGIPILEALNAEVPVLTSTTTSMPEVAGEAAQYVNPESVESIAEGMIILYNNPDLRQELVEKGRIQRQKFSWDKTANLVYGHLRSLVNGRLGNF
jgi:glycosyltransferase involved in cell wall biosynthesis